MSDKRKFPRADAIEVARELCQALKPVCSRLVVAGSLRRGKQLVGDVEILYIARTEPRAVDFFHMQEFNLADEVIKNLLNTGTLVKRPSVKGTFAWGDKNKLALHRSGIPVDMFAATEANWWNYLVCRTGPAGSNTRIAQAAIDKGWKWNPYGSGFSRGGLLAGESEIHEVKSEDDVFRFVGLPYAAPALRE